MAEINVDVNQFPSLTWNHLNINRTKFSGEILSEAKPVVTLAEGIGCEQNNECLEQATSVLTGLGEVFEKQLDEFGKQGSAKLNVFTVEQGLHSNGRTKLSFDCKNGEKNFYDVLIIANENSESSFIFEYSSDDNAEGIFGLRVKVIALEGARVHVSTVNCLGGNYVSFNGCASSAADRAIVEFTQLELGGKQNYNGLKNVLYGYESKYLGQTAYVVQKEKFLDINQVCIQTGRSTESAFTVDGVLFENAKKTWRGTIDFKKGCIDAKGDEQENVLLLNSEPVNKSLPVILCDEEQVEGRHGCSIGKVDLKNLFYMQSRGVDLKTAKELLVKAKVMSVLKHIDDSELEQKVIDFTDKLLMEA